MISANVHKTEEVERINQEILFVYLLSHRFCLHFCIGWMVYLVEKCQGSLVIRLFVFSFFSFYLYIYSHNYFFKAYGSSPKCMHLIDLLVISVRALAWAKYRVLLDLYHVFLDNGFYLIAHKFITFLDTNSNITSTTQTDEYNHTAVLYLNNIFRSFQIGYPTEITNHHWRWGITSCKT